MKKSILIGFLALIVLLSLPVSAAGGKLTAPSVSGKVGEQVRIPIRLDNPGIVATRIFIRYDSKVLTLDKAENGEIFTNGQGVFGKELSADPYTMLWDDSLNTSNNTKSGTLCTLTFTVKEGTPTGTASIRIAVDKASTFDTDLNEVSVADCSCTVGVPTVTTKAQTTAPAATTKAAAPGTKAPLATTTKAAPGTKAPFTTTTTNPATTGKVAAPSEKSSTVPTKTATAAPVSEAIPPKTTAKDTAAEKTVPASSTVTAAALEEQQGDTVPPEESTQTTAAEPDTQAESSVAAPTEASAPQKNLKPLWGLLIIPAAAAVFIVLRRKKA